MFRDPLYALKGKEVIIRANGINYTGKLIEVAPDYVLIRRQQGFAQIRMENVQSIEAADKQNPALRSVGPGHFTDHSPAPSTDKTKKD